MFENPRRAKQARNFTTYVPKILDLKSSSEQIFSENWRWVPLIMARMDMHGLNIKELGHPSQVLMKNIMKKIIMVSAPWWNLFYIFLIILQERFVYGFVS